jgi:acetamidase/formamidase
MTIHDLPLERRTLHGHFSAELPPVLTVEPGDSVRFSTLDAGWGLEAPTPGRPVRVRFEPRDAELDQGHPLVGPIELRGARAGGTLSVRIDEVRVGGYGFTDAGGWSSRLNDRLGMTNGENVTLIWELDADGETGRDQYGRTIALRPFLGVLGMPPPEPGRWPTGPPRRSGGNLDCKELVRGSTLFLPIPVDGALFSAGDGHAAQGDGEVCGQGIECPLDRVQLTLDLRPDLELEAPIADTPAGWLAVGVDDDLDEAAARAIEGMLALLGCELGVSRREALALASVAVDLRVTQLVNGVVGVHALVPHDTLAGVRIS